MFFTDDINAKTDRADRGGTAIRFPLCVEIWLHIGIEGQLSLHLFERLYYHVPAIF